MGRNSSVIMVGGVFEYRVNNRHESGQNIELIIDQLDKLGLVMDKEDYLTAAVRRADDPVGTKRYKAFVVEWGDDDEYHDIRGEPWHIYVGKVISEGNGAVDLGMVEQAIREVKKDFPEPKVLHCTRPVSYLVFL